MLSASRIIDIANPSDGQIPLDPESLSHEFLVDLGTETRYVDRAFMDLLKDTEKVSDVQSEDYDAIYLTSGHGVMFDFTESKDLAEFIAKFDKTGKAVSAVGHDSGGLLSVKLSKGENLINGKDRI
jgi:putative intracellular protease/amidase